MALLALQALLGLLVLLAAGLGCGAWIANALPDGTTRVERFAFSMLGGLGLFSLALFLIGQLSFTRRAIVTALIAGCLLAIRPLWLAWRNRVSFRPAIRKGILLPALVVLFVLVITAVAGTAEITGDWNRDTVAYHLLGPRVWLRTGVIRPVLDNSPTAFPQIPETLFAVLLAIGGERAPDFSSWFTLGLLLLVSVGLAMRLGFESRHAWWVAAIVAAMPAVYSGSHACFVDGLYASFILAAARVGFDAQRPREWAVFGMFCGLAMGTKYTGLLAFPALIFCCVLLLFGKLRPGWGTSIKSLSIALLTACALASPFYVRNWILLGCPIYPPPPHYLLFCNPKYLSQQAIEQFHNYILQRGAGLGRGWLPFFKLPFNLTYHTSNFHGAGGIGLCPLGLAPVGLIALRRSVFARLLGLLAFMLLCAWYLTQQESRFLIPVYVIAAVFSVAGWSHIGARFGKLQRWTAAVLVGISISYGLYMIAVVQAENLQAALSRRYAEAKRQRDIPYLASFEYLNRDPSAKNILILDRSVPPYYLQKSYVKPVGQWGELTVAGAATSLAVLPCAHELGISHVLDVVSPVSGFQIQNTSPDLTLVLQLPDQRIYRVN